METTGNHTAFVRDSTSDTVETRSLDDAQAADGYLPQRPVDDGAIPEMADRMQTAVDSLSEARDAYANDKTPDGLERMLEAVADVISLWPTLSGYLARATD